jgi:ribonuclease P protein component
VTVRFASPGEDPARVQVGWAIGRRVGTAVTRNRLRRRLRALLADEHRAMPLPSGAYVFRVDPSAAGLTYAGLSGHVHELAVAVRRVVPA